MQQINKPQKVDEFRQIKKICKSYRPVGHFVAIQPHQNRIAAKTNITWIIDNGARI